MYQKTVILYDYVTVNPQSITYEPPFNTALTNTIIYLNSKVLLATGWTVRKSIPGWREILSACPDPSWGPPSLLYNRYRVFPGDKAAGAWLRTPTPSSAKLTL